MAERAVVPYKDCTSFEAVCQSVRKEQDSTCSLFKKQSALYRNGMPFRPTNFYKIMDDLRSDFQISEEVNPEGATTFEAYVRSLRTTVQCQLKQKFESPVVRLANPRKKLRRMKVTVVPALHKQDTAAPYDYNAEYYDEEAPGQEEYEIDYSNPMHSPSLKELLDRVSPHLLTQTASTKQAQQVLRTVVPEIEKRPPKEELDANKALTLACRRKKSIDQLAGVSAKMHKH